MGKECRVTTAGRGGGNRDPGTCFRTGNTRSYWVSCGNEPNESESPSATKVTGGSECSGYDVLGDGSLPPKGEFAVQFFCAFPRMSGALISHDQSTEVCIKSSTTQSVCCLCSKFSTYAEERSKFRRQTRKP